MEITLNAAEDSFHSPDRFGSKEVVVGAAVVVVIGMPGTVAL